MGPCPHARPCVGWRVCVRQNVPLEKILPHPMQTLRRNRCQTRTRPREKACVYGVRVSGATIFGYVGGNPLSGIDPSGLDIEYANHAVAAGFNHSKIIITPDNQALYVNDPRFQNFDADGRRFATLGAGPNEALHMESGVNRPRDVSEASAYRKKLDLPCQYADEDAAIKNLFTLTNNYNKNKVWYTLIPHRVFGVATGYNSNSFISGLGGAAGFDMPTPAKTGASTPGYQNPVPASRYR